MRNRGVAVLIHHFSVRLVGGVISTTPDRFTLRKRPGTHYKGSWVGLAVGLGVCGITGWASLWVWVCAKLVGGPRCGSGCVRKYCMGLAVGLGVCENTGWASLCVWVCAEILGYIRILTQNLQAPSESLYQVC